MNVVYFISSQWNISDRIVIIKETTLEKHMIWNLIAGIDNTMIGLLVYVYETKHIILYQYTVTSFGKPCAQLFMNF